VAKGGKILKGGNYGGMGVGMVANATERWYSGHPDINENRPVLWV
jgi:hypothetical protein